MSERTVSVSSVVELPADTVVALLHRAGTLRYVCWPWLTFPADMPDDLGAGEGTEVRLRLAGLVPLWRHELRVVHADAGGMLTEERGGPVRRWRHRLSVEPVDRDRAFYRDEVVVDLGRLTAPAAPVVRALYRWRHRRWARLARELR